MKRIARLLLVLALTAPAASALAVSSYAGGRDVAGPTALQATATSGPTQDSWLGGVAAIGCGFGLRTGGFGGTPVGWGLSISLCLIALADGIRS